jgi:multidrug efflux system membrane fusion protein
MIPTGALVSSFPGGVRSWMLGATVLGASWLSACGGPADAQGGPPPAAPVSVAPAVMRTVTDHEEFSGRLEATEFVELRPRVGGIIERVHFADGALVKKGDLLFTIDPRPFQAEAARAESLRIAAVARAELARSELARAQSLLDAKAVSLQEFDQLTSGSRTAQADIATAEAALRVAQLNLDYAAVRAPISGRVSRAHVTAGNLVGEQVVLTTIAGVERVYAYFDASEQTFLRIKSISGKTPGVRMGLANESGFPHEGEIDFVDNRLNPQTGAIRMRASFDNRKGQFTPGLAARLTMATSPPYEAVLVPERAIGTDQNKKFVYAIGDDNQPQFREVRLGQLLGGMRVVQGGVKAGENIIVDGLQRVAPGRPVAPTVVKVDDAGLPIVPATPPPAEAPSKDSQKSEKKAAIRSDSRSRAAA